MSEELYQVTDDAIAEALSNLHTMTVGRVVVVNSSTVDVQPVINRVVEGESIRLPVFPDVPVAFMQGGTSHETWPISVGDYCLLFIVERCFDRWYAGQDEQSPLDSRIHDYSDSFALVGVNPLAKALSIPSVITRVGDVDHTGDTVHIGNYTQTGDYTITGNIQVNGNITCTGHLIVASANIGGIEFGTHTHKDTQPGIGNTGLPQ